MRVQCPTCHKWLRLAPEVAGKLAGKHVKCPGCGHGVAVPLLAAAHPEDSSVGLAAHGPASESVSAAEPGGGAAADHPVVAASPEAAPAALATAPVVAATSELPTAAAGETGTSQPPVTPPATPPSAPAGTPASGAAFPHLVTPKPKPGGKHEPAHQATEPASKVTVQLSRPVLLAIAGAGVGLVVLVAAVAFWFAGRHADERTVAVTGKSKSSQQKTTPGDAFIEVRLAPEMRSEIGLQVDSHRVTIPDSGEVVCPVKAGKRRLLLRRRGFEQINEELVVAKGERRVYEPEWKPLDLSQQAKLLAASGVGTESSELPKVDFSNPPPAAEAGPRDFDAWLQDWEAAKQRAEAESKDILVLFDGSDWCGYSQRMAEEVFFDPRFPAQVGRDYVLVFVDFPRGDEAKGKVQDAARNQGLLERFGIEGFPTVIVADRKGLPFGRAGYAAGGLDAFQQQLGELQHVHDQLRARVEQYGLFEGEAKARAAQEFFILLERLSLESAYGDLFRQWYQESRQWDPGNKQGYQELLFETAWSARVAEALRTDPERVATVVAELEAWTQEQMFKDKERGARMHLRAAVAMQQDPEAVVKHATAGLAYQPQDEEVRTLLARLKQLGPTLNVLGSGSGFVVGAGGYVLTNRHVAVGPGRLVVRLPGSDKPVPAELIAQDAEHDLALVRVPIPDGVQLAPLRLATTPVSRGTRVGAFGYPLGDLVGKGVRLTTGIVSATPDQTEGALLLDCRINPGNSGGPLCNTRGEVVGIVTAKSRGGASVESYGLALPADQVSAFLAKHLPDFQRPEPAAADQPAAEWDEIDRAVSPSVLMLLQLRGPK